MSPPSKARDTVLRVLPAESVKTQLGLPPCGRVTVISVARGIGSLQKSSPHKASGGFLCRRIVVVTDLSDPQRAVSSVLWPKGSYPKHVVIPFGPMLVSGPP